MYRVIIADDEVIECRGLERMIRTFFSNVELLPSVASGVDLIQSVREQQPDIAIVDINMPGLNGLEAVEILRMKSMDTKVIINTAYHDFDYIKKALVLGASDYLQKPMDEQKFREAFGRVLQTIEKERQKDARAENSSQKLKQLRKVAEAEIMSSIFLGSPNEEEFAVLFEHLNGDYFGGVMVAAASVGDAKFCPAAAREAIEQAVTRYCTCLVRPKKEILYLFLIPGATVHTSHYQEWVGDLLKKTVEDEAGCHCVFGVSSWKYEFEKMSEAFYECQIALRNQEGSTLHFFEAAGKEKELGVLEGALEGLEQLAAGGAWSELEAEIRGRISQYETEQGSLKTLQLWIFRLILQCKRRLDPGYFEGTSESLFAKRVWRQVGECRTPDALFEAVPHFLKEEKKETDSQDIRKRYVQEALLYMERNYMEDLSLEDVAKIVGVSPFYLSRLLKHQTMESFVEVLTDIRVEHAIELIINGDFTVKDIGSRVGYPSRTYFYKVFKKSTGMTVGEMRELLRK